MKKRKIQKKKDGGENESGCDVSTCRRTEERWRWGVEGGREADRETSMVALVWISQGCGVMVRGQNMSDKPDRSH